MKNFIAKTAAVAALSGVLLSSSAFAGQEGGFYLKLDGGATMLNNLKQDGKRVKGKIGPDVSFAAGYYLMDNVRADLSFGMLFNPKHQSSKSTDAQNKAEFKGDVKYLMLNAYVDLFDLSVVKVFAGVGAGSAHVKSKATHKSNSVSNTMKSKAKYNFTYHLTAGASAEVAQGVNLELAYSWKDFGKPGAFDTKSKIFENKTKVSYKGHNLSAGVRFDL